MSVEGAGRSISGFVRKPLPVLVVDDDPDARQILRAFLEAAGYAVTEAVDGLDAVHEMGVLHRGGILPLVVTDLRMPRMDGWTLCAALRTDVRFAHVPIIVCSASAEAVPQATDVIPKPIDPVRLLAALARCHGRVSDRAAATADE